jgi:hypothetical protein
VSRIDDRAHTLTRRNLGQTVKQCTLGSINKFRSELARQSSSQKKSTILLFTSETDCYPANPIFLVCAYMVSDTWAAAIYNFLFQPTESIKQVADLRFKACDALARFSTFSEVF